MAVIKNKKMGVAVLNKTYEVYSDVNELASGIDFHDKFPDYKVRILFEPQFCGDSETEEKAGWLTVSESALSDWLNDKEEAAWAYLQ
ncbi:hypothetical protein AGMMS4957_14780 [Bacteroidia bacterium]|nr:hypothetical protein AGMMS4957_14780 [Bacteroidia bacterium]